VSKDLEIIYQLENKLDTSLERLDKIDFLKTKDGYVIDDRGNVIGLSLYGNLFASLSAVKDLTNLTTLHLSGNQLDDITAVKNLKNLTMLDLNSNHITDIYAVNDLTNLTELDLSSNRITDIYAVNDLINLTELDLSGNQITDIYAVNDLINLTELDLSGNQITDIYAVNDLINLTELDLSGNLLTNISSVKNLKNLTKLDLNDNQISDISCLKGLTNLTTLGLSFNQISDISRLKGLTNLTTLDLSYNQISDISSLKDLKNLTRLDLNNNQISDIFAIKNLKNLTKLDLNYNQISDISSLKDLKNLTRLDLDNNQITDIYAVNDLTNLTTLDLGHNRVKKIPKELLDIKIEILWKNNFFMEGLNLYGNPLELPPLEIVTQGKKSIRNYFESIEKETSRVFEAKLLVVGEGGVGKTCLMKRLMFPEKGINQSELTTEGIDINQWIIQTAKANNFRINFWDFGGQEIYHATHQFFLTKRSLYLFVWDARTDDSLTSFDYWLNVVRLLSDNSPVIVVLNKIDERIRSIDEHSIQTKFNNIVAFDKVSALKSIGIEGLTSTIREHITELPHVGDILPTVWIDIRKKLESLDKDFISYDAYKAICSRFDLDEQKAEHLSRYYHDLGVFLYFQDNPVLREIVFLKPDWATNAVYKLIDTKEIQKVDGKFHFDQLKKIWSDYPQDKYAHLLELMKKFELCFRIPRTQTYIVPELLSPGKPDFEWDYTDNLRFEYRYEFMPAGIITRFIVRTHDIIEKDIYWKNGVVLQRENTEALVVSEQLNRKIRIWVRGENRKELLAIIRREIDYIHETLNKPDVKQMIPCICKECKQNPEPYFHNYEDLLKAKQKGKRQIECKESFESISIDELFGEYEKDLDKLTTTFDSGLALRAKEKRPDVVIQQTFLQEMKLPEKSEKPRKGKQYKTWKWIWAIIAGIIIILGGLWTAIQIYEHFSNSKSNIKTEEVIKEDIPASENNPPEDVNSPN